MEEELRFHLEMETHRLIGDGMAADEARRRALVAFGAVDRTREELRDGRGTAWLSGLSLDLRLGARMLTKFPVLTLASVAALALAISLASAWFEFSGDITRPDIPLPAGDRMVVLRNVDRTAGSEPRFLHDFETWRGAVRTIDDLTAVSVLELLATTDDGRYATLNGARVTPSMFSLTRVAAAHGRVLTEADAEPASPLVVVLSDLAWRRLFDGDPAAIGATVRLGAEKATVVGVMPPGFGFPVNHEAWTPLRERALAYERGRGPSIVAYGRLAPGVRLATAQAEMDVLGERAAETFPQTNGSVRPVVRRFGDAGPMRYIAAALNLPFLLFLIVVSANVATLFFARTATRESEIALRSALGASRRRILLQLSAEAMVLTTAACALGLSVAALGLRWGMERFWEVQQSRPPFWIDPGISVSTAAYAFLLSVVGAVIIGALPGIRATRPGLRDRILHPATSGMKFGRIATGVIILQVALCVAVIPVAILTARSALDVDASATYPADQFLAGRLIRQSAAGTATDAAGSAELFDAVARRIDAEPGVRVATVVSRLPGFNHPGESIEIDGEQETAYIRRVDVDTRFFDVMDAPIVSGRAFRDVDASGRSRVAIVAQEWASSVFGGDPVGRRFRYAARAGQDPGPWYEVVGVVRGMDRLTGPGEDVAVLHPLGPEERSSVYVYMRTEGSPGALVPRIQELATSLDPSLGFTDLMPLSEVWRPVERADAFFVRILALVAGVILLFALIGIYALTSFTVTQRSREIGIRAALGARPARILATIFARGALQITAGIALGALLVGLTAARSPGGLRLVGGVAVAMALIGLIGCAVPAIRALRVQPVDAMRAE